MSVELDAYIIDTLMADLVGHDRQPSAFLVYLLLYRRTTAMGRSQLRVPLGELAESTGLSKRTVQNALSWLQHRKLVTASRSSATDVPAYRVHSPWKRGGATAGVNL
jgi:DNA-binding transcriptional ArsR family regulator